MMMMMMTRRRRRQRGAAERGATRPARSATATAAVRVLRSYARLPRARPDLLRGAAGAELLSSLAGWLERGEEEGGGGVAAEVLGLLRDLTHGCDDAEAGRVEGHPGLLGSALGLLDGPGPEPGPDRSRAEEYAALVLWNLAARRPVRPSLAARPEVLGALLRWTGTGTGTGTGGEEARRAALSALGNLARGGGGAGAGAGAGAEARDADADADADADPPGGPAAACPCVLAIASHGGGAVLEGLLSVAASGTGVEGDAGGGAPTPKPGADPAAAPTGGAASVVCRRRAARTLRCLLRRGADGEAVRRSASHRGLRLARDLSGIMAGDADRHVRLQATECVASLYGLCEKKAGGRRRLREGGDGGNGGGGAGGGLTEVDGDDDHADFLITRGALIHSISSPPPRAGGGGTGLASDPAGMSVACAEVACNALSRASTPEGAYASALDEHPTLLGRLVDVLTNGTEDGALDLRLAAVKFLHALSKCERNCRAILASVPVEGATESSDSAATVLDALAGMLQPPRKGEGTTAEVAAAAEAQPIAAGVVVELSRHTSATDRIVLKHPKLLANFVAYCTMSDGLGGEVKEAAMRLVSSL